MFISAPLHATENAGLEVGPAVEMNQTTDQVALRVPRVKGGSGVWKVSLMRYLHLDAAFLQRQNPFLEGIWTMRP